jgi:hypothetical protein
MNMGQQSTYESDVLTASEHLPAILSRDQRSLRSSTPSVMAMGRKGFLLAVQNALDLNRGLLEQNNEKHGALCPLFTQAEIELQRHLGSTLDTPPDQSEADQPNSMGLRQTLP